MNNRTSCLLIPFLALLLPIAVLGPARAAGSPGDGFTDEFDKQRRIYHSRGGAIPDGYVVDRSLAVYTHGLCIGFRSALSELAPRDRWLDIGAGQGHAILDYLQGKYDALIFSDRPAPVERAPTVAISIEDRRTRRWAEMESKSRPGQLRYLPGKPLREYSPIELGTFNLITDVLGGFSYAADLSHFVERVLALLDVNGQFFTILGDVQTETFSRQPYHADNHFLTEIRTPDGREVPACQWLKSIACVTVRCESKEWEPPGEAYHLKKVCDAVSIPRLIPVHYEAGTPPGRRYILQQ